MDPGQRWSVARKQEVVLRLLRGWNRWRREKNGYRSRAEVQAA